ncbi:MAG: 7-cyano-7-deazaguanine synthase, partial [Actinobacteria bacterium]|nr:7-cyano-7-deazaguanine synthase [Actinomycetota bacterium]
MARPRVAPEPGRDPRARPLDRSGTGRDASRGLRAVVGAGDPCPEASGPGLSDLLARCRFPEERAPLTCAVSGGADSLALLVLAVSAGCRVTAVHVDHGLRPDSASEAEVVASAAARFGAGFRSERVEVDRGPNLE